jgi:hypothetical protein
MIYRSFLGTLALMAALLLPIVGAAAQDESKYPDWKGLWRRAPGVGPYSAASSEGSLRWDETKPRFKQEAPLSPEYQAIWEASVADQAAGGQGGDTRVKCISYGMPRMMTFLRPIGFFILREMTMVVYDNNIPRWIYTDGREMPTDAEPSYGGYSVGKWLDTDGDGRFDTLEVETRNFKGPRTYDDTGIPLHYDNESIIKERLSLDKSNPNILLNEITVYDHALTRPWIVTKHYYRVPGRVEFQEDQCSENNVHVFIGTEGYFVSGDGYLMPTKKDQPAPDLRYFKQTQK